MNERERQTEFLYKLLKNETGPSKRLKDRIIEAERNEYCIRRALILMVLVGVFSVVGLGYSAVLLPEFFDNAMPLLVKVFCALGLGSLFCMLIFGACLLWYRKASNEISEACRHQIIEDLKRREVKLDFQKPMSVHRSLAELYQNGTSDPQDDPRIIKFPRAS